MAASIEDDPRIVNILDWQKKPEEEEIDIESLLDSVTLTEEHVKKMADAKFLYPNLVVQGHITAFIAPGNGGKSALFRHVCEYLVSVHEMKVVYINVDANPPDLKKHYSHGEEYGYRVVAPDAIKGRSIDDVIDIMKQMAFSAADLSDYVFILDTLKKFNDMINKKMSKEFYNMLRVLSTKGATICLLGHTNKHKGIDGKPIFEGTGDLRNDIDDMLYLESNLDELRNVLEVTTAPDKVRAYFEPISFEIDRKNGLKVTPLAKVADIYSNDEKEVIFAIIEAINEGCSSQQEIVDYVVENSNGISAKRARNTLVFFSREPRRVFSESTSFSKNRKSYTIFKKDFH